MLSFRHNDESGARVDYNSLPKEQKKTYEIPLGEPLNSPKHKEEEEEEEEEGGGGWVEDEFKGLADKVISTRVQLTKGGGGGGGGWVEDEFKGLADKVISTRVQLINGVKYKGLSGHSVL
uniref:Uncharacterized protein n=1 Tax=Solanum tuberosum TaxID=4113 RepID=M1DW12_SOLTU